MKSIEWVGLAVAGIIIIIIIAKIESPNPALTNGASNSLVGGLGSFFAGLTKVTAPSANPGFTSPGSTGTNYVGGFQGDTNLSGQAYGQQYSAAMASTAESAAATAGAGGVSVGGGLSQSESTNSFQLTPPSFDVGVNGADFSTI